MTSTPASAHTPDPTKPYYVIIGCGFSGILNHVLLRHTGRLKGRDVLHIGEPDPWRSYHSMPMGQWPSLLAMPGFMHKPAVPNPYANLESDKFAEINQREWDWLYQNYRFDHAVGPVTAIRKSATRQDEYEVQLHDGTIFRAECVDVCGGPGPARTPPPTLAADPTLLSEFDGAIGTCGWPRLVSGEDFLTATTPAVPPGHNICVYGGGPTGAWCVEHAQDLGHTVYWMSSKKLNEAFVASRRNDALAKGPVVRENIGGDWVVTGSLRPANSSTFFGEDLVATAVTPTGIDEVEISFTPAKPSAWRFVGSSGPIPPSIVLTLPVHQMVLSIGQETADTETRSWAHLLRQVLDDALFKGKHLITDGQRRVVGLQSEDEHVRVLGAAALSHQLVVAEWKRPGSPSNLFFHSLVEQARVPNGITLSAITIAEANGFWSSAPNRNLNTCGFDDLEKLIGVWPPEWLGPETWFELRGHRIPPFEIDEFMDLAQHDVSY